MGEDEFELDCEEVGPYTIMLEAVTVDGAPSNYYSVFVYNDEETRTAEQRTIFSKKILGAIKKELESQNVMQEIQEHYDNQDYDYLEMMAPANMDKTQVVDHYCDAYQKARKCLSLRRTHERGQEDGLLNTILMGPLVENGVGKKAAEKIAQLQSEAIHEHFRLKAKGLSR